MTDWLAHSARYGRPSQSYVAHIGGVLRGALRRARAMLRHYSPYLMQTEKWPNRREFLEIIYDAASFHDFGKLDDGFQETLQNNRMSPRHVRHEDAGVALLSGQGAMEAAGLVGAHHRGLVRYEYVRSQPRLGRAREKCLSEVPFRIDDPETQVATRDRIGEYRHRHEQAIGTCTAHAGDGLSRCGGFVRRLLLSCLVDADHSDTACHYGQGNSSAIPLPRWKERLAALDSYVAGLSGRTNEATGETERLRQYVRDALYAECRGASSAQRLMTCDAVVGSGKTTAVMAHLLKVADERRLRHIFVVLPYTNIIRQSVEVYRKALCLPGEVLEDMEAVVAEHHHQAAFRDVGLRGLTTLWQAPIIVTTAVQFFETLAANETGKLRKLHELPGSAVFIDEAHAALPGDMWPVCWNWLNEWTREWNGHVVLASGSLAEFWSLDEFRSIIEGKTPGLPCSAPTPIVTPLAQTLGESFCTTEHLRVRFDSRKEPVTADSLSEWIEKSAGPRLVIVNTVQSAAVLARHMIERDTQDILHLTTALAPMDRAVIVAKIKAWLKERSNWTLVATSLVEAGMDFSFATGFRQRCSAASLIQTGGRVNRDADRADVGMVFDFDFVDTRIFPDNPAIKSSKQALSVLFQEGLISTDRPNDFARICRTALQMEFKARQQNMALEVVMDEIDWNYPAVAEKCRVIRGDTRLVLVDSRIAERLSNGFPVTHDELIRSSVQMHLSKAIDFGLPSVLAGSQELFVLPEGWRYDPDCFGYMAGWFDMDKAKIAGGYLI